MREARVEILVEEPSMEHFLRELLPVVLPDGYLNAVEKVYPESKASMQSGKAKFRNPDFLVGSDEMKKLTGTFTKSFASKEIPKHFTLDENKSPSFNHLIKGIKSFLG